MDPEIEKADHTPPDMNKRRTAFTRANVTEENEARIISAPISSETPYKRYDWSAERYYNEVLGHKAEEIDLTYLNDGAPILYNHQSYGNALPIGVIERAWLENNRLYAEMRLSKREDVNDIWQEITDGILRNVSVGYDVEAYLIEEFEDGAIPMYRAKRWTPRELSLCAIPADATVGIGRNTHSSPQPKQHEIIMPPEDIQDPTVNDPTTRTANPSADPAPAPANDKAGLTRAAEEGAALERKRTADIYASFAPFPQHANLKERCVSEGQTHEQARELLLKAIGDDAPQPQAPGDIRVGESDNQKFSRAAEDTLVARALGGFKDEDGKQITPSSHGLGAMTLQRVAEECLTRSGDASGGYGNALELIGRAFTHSSSDFPRILANVANRALLRGYDETPEVFDVFTRTLSLSDFKQATMAGLGSFSDLDKIPESGEYKEGTFAEESEGIKLATYGKLFTINRQAVINDDLQAFTAVPRKMGQAARRKVGDLAFSVLTSNPTMGDGTKLFHTDHKNLAASGTAPSAVSFGAARTAMRTQKDGKAVLNIRPKYVIAPVALEDTINVLLASETDPAQSNSRKPNVVRNMVQPVYDARLDEASASAFYFSADPHMFDAIGVAYLNGMSAPYMEQQEGFTSDGMKYKVRIDAAAAPLGWRTMYKNPGA